MEESHLWTEEARDALLEALPGWDDTLEPETTALIANALVAFPLDTLLVVSADESARLNTEEVPHSEWSHAALITLLSSLEWGPGRWVDSFEIESAMGEWSPDVEPGDWGRE